MTRRSRFFSGWHEDPAPDPWLKHSGSPRALPPTSSGPFAGRDGSHMPPPRSELVDRSCEQRPALPALPAADRDHAPPAGASEPYDQGRLGPDRVHRRGGCRLSGGAGEGDLSHTPGGSRPSGALRLRLTGLRAQPPAIRRRIVALAAVAAGAPAPSFERIQAVDRLVDGGRSRGPVQLEGELAVYRGAREPRSMEN